MRDSTEETPMKKSRLTGCTTGEGIAGTSPVQWGRGSMVLIDSAGNRPQMNWVRETFTVRARRATARHWMRMGLW